MKIRCIWEHNGADSLLYAQDLPGAFARGASLQIAMEKMDGEIAAYCRWRGLKAPEAAEVVIVQEKESDLKVCDADSDVIFDAERPALEADEYVLLKAVALQSAADFQALYDSIPDKGHSCLPARDTFYGPRPRTAQQMYEHTKNVNAYYFGEIGVDADNDGGIGDCRVRGFALLEAQADFLIRPPVCGSYGEEWSLRKLLRRFIWHDRIHAKAMYRMAKASFPDGEIANPFCF